MSSMVSNSEDARTVIEWSFGPKDFFEEPFSMEFGGGKIAVTSGKARGEFPADAYEGGEVFRDQAHDCLKAAFLAQQIKNHKAFDLRSEAMAKEYPGGRRDVTVFVEPLRVTMSVGEVDVLITDGDGQVVKDTKAERLKNHSEFRLDVTGQATSDSCLRQMLHSFSSALSDSKNSLVHLYEVRDAAVSKFGNDNEARGALNISSSKWSAFGRLVNDSPLLEGRHRGRHETLRAANKAEKDQALEFAQSIIEAYVAWLKEGDGTGKNLR